MSNDLGLDRSGNGNNWTVNNITYADQMVDSPTNNFATMNPLVKHTNVATTYSEGNLKIYKAATYWTSTLTTMYMDSGKWYAEFCCLTDGAYMIFGINAEGDLYANNHPGADSSGYGYGYVFDTAAGRGDITYQNQTVSTGGAFTNLAVGTIIGITLDFDNNQVKFYANNALQYTESIGARPYTYSLAPHGGYIVSNFGQDSSFAGNKTAQGNQDGNSIGDFYYAPPTGFLALCTSNLPDVAVVPSEHFNTITYSGNSTNRTLTGVGFTPSFTWIKSRSNATNGSDHFLFDAVRGVNAFKGLCSNGTSVEGETAAGSAQENFGDISAFTSDGYSVYRSTADPSHQYEAVNNNSETYVAWNWKANGSGSSNTNGSTNSTVSANTDAGFSIVSYTGSSGPDTIGHGLSKAPEMIIVKDRSSAQEWLVYHHSLTDAKDKYLRLDTTSAVADNTFWNDTAPTNQVFSVGDSQPVNSGHGDSYIAYCFHSVDGYSKVGTYIGNNNDDGTFVYTGFRPKWIMVKSSSVGGNHYDWAIYDTARSSYNAVGNVLEANQSQAEVTGTGRGLPIDIVSNGFKHRSGYAENNSDKTYIYIAFAETPFKYSNAR